VKRRRGAPRKEKGGGESCREVTEAGKEKTSVIDATFSRAQKRGDERRMLESVFAERRKIVNKKKNVSSLKKKML